MSERIVTINPGETLKIIVSEEKEEYSISEFCKLAKLSRSTVYRKNEKGEIPFITSGKTPKISHETLVKFKNK